MAKSPPNRQATSVGVTTGIAPVEPPTGVLDQVAAVTEVLGHRQEELDQTQHTLMLTRGQIQAERRRWEQELGEAQQALRIQQQHLEELYRAKQAEVEQEHRRCQDATTRAKEYEAETRQRLLTVVEREQVIAGLNQERLEVAKIRQALEVQRAENSQLYSNACLARDQGATALAQAKQLEASCEDRNRLMNEEWNKLMAWQTALDLRQKDADVVLHQIDEKLVALRKLEPVATSQEESSHES